MYVITNLYSGKYIFIYLGKPNKYIVICIWEESDRATNGENKCVCDRLPGIKDRIRDVKESERGKGSDRQREAVGERDGSESGARER